MATFTTSDGVGLHYTDDGDGPPVVLLAGFCAPLQSWEFQRRALLGAGQRVIALDRRSHGISDNVTHGQRLSRHGADVRELLDELSLHDVALAGQSMGGSVIWAYYDLFGADRLRAIVIIDQTPRMINNDDWQFGFYNLSNTNIGTYFDNGIPQTGRGKADRLTGFRKLEALLGYDPPFGNPTDPPLRALLQDHAAQDWRDVVARVSVPSLFLAARDSQLWPCEHAAWATSVNASASAVTLEDCGHAMCVDQSDAVSAAMVEFLR